VVENKSQSILDIAVKMKMNPFDDIEETEINANPSIGSISLFEFKDAHVLSQPTAGKHKILGRKDLCYYTLRSFTMNYDPDKYDGRQHEHRNHSGYIVHRLNRTLAKQETFDETVLQEFVDFVPYVARPLPSNAASRGISGESNTTWYSAKQVQVQE
jgi:hypothetical protein